MWRDWASGEESDFPGYLGSEGQSWDGTKGMHISDPGGY